jgi:phthalate 4,5-cis-dihydrodiol dehydrogenase
MRLRLGLAGLGTAGRAVPGAVSQNPGYTLTAGADTRAEARERYRAQYGIRVFESVSAMCDSPEVDVVYVATPNPCHAEHAITAAEGGKHIIVEKPMALTLEECEQMITAAARNHVRLMVAHTRSFNPPIRKMRELISSGQLGQVIQITTLRYAPWLLRPREPVELETKLGGGVCYRQAPHQVDIARLLGGGLVRSVRASAGRWDPQNATEGNYTAFLEFENRAAATLVYDGYGYFDDSELTGESNVDFDRPGPGQRLRSAKEKGLLDKESSRSGLAFEIEGRRGGGSGEGRQPFYGMTLVSCERGVVRQSPNGILIYGKEGVREVPCAAWLGPLCMELQDFYQCLVSDKRVAHDGLWGKATLEVCLAIMKSSQQKRDVTLSHQVASPY